MKTYKDVAPIYHDAGWSPLPLPAGKKASPPDGWTGTAGRWPTVDEIRLWTQTHPDGNVGLRVPDSVIGIDVDDYDGKDGGVTLAALEAELGPLPATWTSTSRGPGVSGIRVYRIPAGTSLPGVLGPGIDIIQHHHRYLVASPSVHPDGRQYRWYMPDGSRPTAPPLVGELPDLPAAWLERFKINPEPPKAVTPSRLTLVDDDDSIAARIKADHDWRTILTADGWTLTSDGQTESRWARPGKSRGTSGVLHEPDGPFNVFSTDGGIGALQQTWAYNNNQTCWTYSMFGYLAATRHNGNRSDLARTYRQQVNNYDPQRSAPKVIALLDAEPEQAAGVDEEWPELIPLGESISVAPFPTHVLPDWMQPIVIAISADLQAEPDLAGVLGIVALSTACAGQRRVIVRNSWREPLNIYAAVALPPSSGKSPAFKWMTGPIKAYEVAQIEQVAGKVEHVAQTRRMIEKAMKRAEDKGDAQEARIQLDKLLNTPEAHPFRLVLDDTTPEALVQKLHDHGQRLAILSTEGGPFGMMGGRYSDSANLDPYLKPWSNDPIAVDRIGRPTTIINKPVLTIGLTVQPSVIAALSENPEMIGRGLTARFMYSVPMTNTGHRDMFWESDIPEHVWEPYNRRLTGLLTSELDAEAPGDITIDREAVLEFHGWRQGLENQRGAGGELQPVAEWTTKLESTVARVAGLFALADLVEHIDVPTMRRALALGDYWLSHIRAVVDLWGRDENVAMARQVVAWMTARELSEFSVRDLYRSCRALFPTADDTRPVLNLLTERGWIRPMFDGPLVLGRRGVESPRFAVNPQTLISSHVRNNHGAHGAHGPKQISDGTYLLSRNPEGVPPPDMTDMSAMTPEAHPGHLEESSPHKVTNSAAPDFDPNPDVF